MRIYCQCGVAASVGRSQKLADYVSAISCSCKDPECGHSFVSELGFKHSVALPLASMPGGMQLGGYAQGGRIHCGCGSRARITKTNRLSSNVADIYCECGACGHRFVMSLSFSHTLSPSAKTTNELAMAVIRSLTPASRVQLREQLALF